jgi:hypothetical protein
VSALVRRVQKLEAVAMEETRRRFTAAIESLAQSMSTEHRRAAAGWLCSYGTTGKRCGAMHDRGRFCLQCIAADDPPALPFAVWVMIFAHVENETPVALPPDVARVYVEYPDDAVPGRPCPSCGYLLPVRPVGPVYVGCCPVCGRGDGPEEAAK